MGRQRQTAASDHAFAQRVLDAGAELTRLAMAVLNDASLAEDAVAGAYLKAWQHRRTLRDETRLRPWLKRICRNEALGLRRRRRRQERVLVDLDPDRIASRESGFDESRLRAELLEQLPRQLKSCATMFFLEGRGYSEIAAVEGLPLSTVRGRIYQARQHLRKGIDMTTKPTGPRVDEYDDGTIRARPGEVVRWRGMRIRLLGLGWYGRKRLYDAAGKRLSRTPAILRQSSVYTGKGAYHVQGRRPDLCTFWELSGEVDGYMATNVRTSMPNVNRTIGDRAGSKSITCDLSTVPPGSGDWLAVRTVAIGPILRDEESAVRFEMDVTKGEALASRPGWGSVYVFQARRGRRKGTCELALAYSSTSGEWDWAVLALTKAGETVKSDHQNRGNAECDQGHLTGMTVSFPVPAREVAGVVFRPRPRVTIKWGRFHMPPGTDRIE